MKLSDLQKYTLRQAYLAEGKKINKKLIEKFYSNHKDKPKPKDLIEIITKSTERLIKKDLAVGYGKKTAHKWFIQQVELTPVGRRIAKNLFGVQQKLPFKSRNKK